MIPLGEGLRRTYLWIDSQVAARLAPRPGGRRGAGEFRTSETVSPMTDLGYAANVHLGCPICGGSDSAPFIVVDGYSIVRCGVCGTIHVSPLPPDEVLTAHYQDPGYFHGQGNQGYRDYAQVRKALIPHFRRRLVEIDRHFVAPGRLLDFGSAAGYFLEVPRLMAGV